MECTVQRCPATADLPRSCTGAVTCKVDPCDMCSIHFYDKNGREILPSACHSDRPAQEPYPRDSCNPADSNCCPDSLRPLQCPAEIMDRVCPNIRCEGVRVARCVVDGCKYCNIRIFDSRNKEVNVLDKCEIASGQPVARPTPAAADKCADVVCPAVQPMCGDRPPLCPEQMDLQCVLDPCVCISLWVDAATGLPPRCTADYRPPCIPPDKCPADFECGEAPADLDIPDVIRSHLICIQEPCTCRPIVTLDECIDKSECPAVTRASCGDIHPALKTAYSQEDLDRFECVIEDCTCRAVWVPPEDFTMTDPALIDATLSQGLP